ncbi:hypothetical protein K1719_038197 [Acacia pycnantha]|nr:hypothetical protein K1719_038197 [Acacia pycnantha]
MNDAAENVVPYQSQLENKSEMSSSSRAAIPLNRTLTTEPRDTVRKSENLSVTEGTRIRKREKSETKDHMQKRFGIKIYPFERFLYTLKQKARDKARVEASICEAYIAEETAMFCSHYFEPGFIPCREQHGLDNDQFGRSPVDGFENLNQLSDHDFSRTGPILNQKSSGRMASRSSKCDSSQLSTPQSSIPQQCPRLSIPPMTTTSSSSIPKDLFHKEVRPKWIPYEVMNQLESLWTSLEYLSKCEITTTNQASSKGGTQQKWGSTPNIEPKKRMIRLYL